MVARAFVSCILVLSVYGCAVAVDGSEPLGEGSEAVNPTSCATATRDAVVNSSASQASPVSSPATYDNAGCNEGYIVEYDGTVSGVHYGYRLEDPRPGTNDGVRLTFSVPVPKPLHTCDGVLRGGGYLYEKQSNGTWSLVRTAFVDSTTTGGPSSTFCAMAPILFNEVRKGSATTPHIYRFALTLDVLDPSALVGSYPDGQGYGPFTLRGYDVNNPPP